MSKIGRLGAGLWSDPGTRGAVVGALVTALLTLLGWALLQAIEVVKTHGMAISVQDPIVTGDGVKVTVRNDGDRPGMLYGALIEIQPDRADEKKLFSFQLLPSERMSGILLNPGTPTYVSLTFEDRWQGATNLLAVFLMHSQLLITGWRVVR
jgi:hypothetical protein